MNVENYLRNLEGEELNRNNWTQLAREQTEAFLKKYEFVQKDLGYLHFMRKIGGAEVYNPDFLLVIYGFALSESEFVYPVDKYLNKEKYLVIGEYTEKRIPYKWKGIGYYYFLDDDKPIIYAKFNQEDDAKIGKGYYPLCIGFENLIKTSTTKSYFEQLIIAEM